MTIVGPTADQSAVPSAVARRRARGSRFCLSFVAVADGRFQPSSRGVFLHRPRVGSDKAFLAHIDVMMPITNSDWEESDASIVAFMKAFLPEVEKCLFGVTGTPS